jgi:hypothetical protein
MRAGGPFANRLLTEHLGHAAGIRQVGELWRFAKQPGRSSRIDACIEVAMAHSTLIDHPPNPGFLL